MFRSPVLFIFFFFNDTATTEIYTLSLHDALPILEAGGTSLREPMTTFYGDRTAGVKDPGGNSWWIACHVEDVSQDRKSTRLNSSHGYISYAVFCLKKKKTTRVHAWVESSSRRLNY